MLKNKRKSPQKDAKLVDYVNLKAQSSYNAKEAWRSGRAQKIDKDTNIRYTDSYSILSRGDEKAVAYIWDALYGRVDILPYPRPGGSQFVTQEVLEAIEKAMPLIVRALLGSQRIGEFKARNPEDETFAAMETDIVNTYLLQSPGVKGSYQQLYSFIKNCLIVPNSYGKVYVNVEQRVVADTKYGILGDELEAMRQNPKVTITHEESEEEMQDGAPIVVHNVEYTQETYEPQFMFESIPDEEIIVDADWNHHDLDECPYVMHRTKKTLSQLREMGYEISDAQASEWSGADGFSGMSGDGLQWSEGYQSRRDDVDPTSYSYSEHYDQPPLKSYIHQEAYLLYDFDGDGVAERRKVCVVEDTLLYNAAHHFMPIFNASCILMPNRHRGMSEAQIMIPVQELKTALTRAGLDNLNELVDRKYHLYDGALSPLGDTERSMGDRNKKVTKMRGNPNQDLLIEDPPNIVQDVLAFMQRADMITDERSGTSSGAQKTVENLQNTPAGTFADAKDAAEERVALMIRTIAETGFKPLLAKTHYLLRQYPELVRSINVRGEWQQVDTSQWPERTDVKVVVGLGFLNKNQKVTAVMQFLGVQQQLGPTFVEDRHVYALAGMLPEVMGLGSPTQFLRNPSDPNTEPPPEPPPDPEQIKAQTQLQIAQLNQQTEQMKIQAQAQMKQMEIENMAQTEQTKASIDIDRIDGSQEMEILKLQHERDKASLESQLQELKVQNEMLLAETKAGELEVKALQGEAKAALDTASIEEVQAKAQKLLAEIDKVHAEAEAVRRGDMAKKEKKDEGTSD